MKALELLRSEDTTASGVTYRVGFSSPPYFNNCFHEYFGYPPGKVKRDSKTDQDMETVSRHTSKEEIINNRLRKYILTLPGILFLIMMSGMIVYLAYKTIQKSLFKDVIFSSDKPISLVVMPFQNRTNDTLWNVWQEGIQECLIYALSNSKELKITQRETTHELFKNQGISNYTNITPASSVAISKKLDAKAFIFGSIIKTGSVLRLNVQLIDAKTEEILKTFEINGSNKQELILDMVDSLRNQITDFLLISRMIKENPWVQQLLSQSTRSADALKYYIYGNNAFFKADWVTARIWFLKALDRDSDYIAPISKIYYTLKNQGLKYQSLPWLLRLYRKRDQMPDVTRLLTSWSYAEIFESPEKAIKYLRQLQDIDKDGNYYYLIGAMYVRAKQYEKAIPEF